jgi:hypothetical protein
MINQVKVGYNLCLKNMQGFYISENTLLKSYSIESNKIY